MVFDMSITVRRSVTRISAGDEQPRLIDDDVAADRVLEVFVGNEYFRTFLCSPGLERELALGHLLAQGVIDSADEIEHIHSKESRVSVILKTNRLSRLEASKIDRLITISCGAVTSQTNLLTRLRPPHTYSSLHISAARILELVRDLNLRSQVFKATGGTHSAMLCDENGKVLAYAEDVGRHNAVDKVIGIVAFMKHDFSQCILVSSGRQSGDMVLKAATAGVPIVVSQAAPLDSGIKVALDTGVTLVCFVRGRRMNIYTGPERILVD